MTTMLVTRELSQRKMPGESTLESPVVTPKHPEQFPQREEFEYIVIGTGAGGGPVAANLAKAGRRVLVLKAGGTGRNRRSLFKYEIPGTIRVLI
jgi:hypothetical protein